MIFWKMTMEDGSVKQHIDDGLCAACSHHVVEKAKVKSFEVIEGGVTLWSYPGMPRNIRRRSMRVVNPQGINAAQECYVIVLFNEVVFVFADGKIVKLRHFLPAKYPGDGKFGGVALLNRRGDVVIDGIEYPSGYAMFTPIVRHEPTETEQDLCPDLTDTALEYFKKDPG